MKIFEKIEQPVDVLTDVICDCCGNSCKTPNSDYGISYMTLSARWGFMSGKDLEQWEATVCEKCVDEKLGFIKFEKSNYITGSPTKHYKNKNEQ